MTNPKITRQDFDRLQEAWMAFAERLTETDRHERGGTTLGEAMESPGIGEAFAAVLSDPRHIRSYIALRLVWWIGEKNEWNDDPYGRKGKLILDAFHPPGIAALGTPGYDGLPIQSVEEVGIRAARAPEMTQEKSNELVTDLEELAVLCLDVAQAFENRLETEGGIRRVQ